MGTYLFPPGFWDGFWEDKGEQTVTTIWQFVVLNEDEDEVVDFGFVVADSKEDALVQAARQYDEGRILVKPFA